MPPLAVFRMHKVHNGPGRPSAVLRQAVDVKLCPAILQLFLSKVHCHCAWGRDRVPPQHPNHSAQHCIR